MSKIGVISAIPVEIEGLAGSLKAHRLSDQGFQQIYETEVNGNTVVIVSAGIGKASAARGAQRLLDLYHVDVLVNMGIAGAVSKALKALDVVIGDEIHYHDFAPVHLLQSCYPYANVFKSDSKLLAAAKQLGNTPIEGKAVIGHLATGDKFIETDEEKAAIEAQTGAIACEMEGAAIAQTAFIAHVPFLAVRSISDLADKGAWASYKEFERKAALQANKIVEALLLAV